MRTLSISFLVALLAAPSFAQPVQGQARAQAGERGFARVLVFSRDDAGNFSIPVQYQFTFGQPAWKDSYEPQLKQMAEAGRAVRWRFGTDGWTTFDTNRNLEMAGVKVPAGLYYCCIERAVGGKASLVLLDPKKVHEQKLDAFMCDQTKGGITVPLALKEDAENVEKMTISFKDTEKPSASTMVIAWGPRRLTAGVKVLE